MDNKKISDQVKAKITGESPDFTGHQPLDRVYIFFSYDLVNSSRYKSINRTQWPLVIKRFYELIEDGISKWLSNVRLWKYVGDEVLLYKEILCIDDIHGCASSAHKILKITINRLYQDFPDSKTIISVKATIWSAKVTNVGSQDIRLIKTNISSAKSANIIVTEPMDSTGERLDFLGPDIDLGFRIAKHAIRERLIISADLSFILLRKEPKIKNKLRIISYEHLKGVWGERRYPIIWYEDDWGKILETFLYDERYESDIVNNIFRDHDKLEKVDIDNLLKMYEDLDKKTEIEGLWQSLSITKCIPAESTPSLIPQGNLAEVHCVAICFRDDKRILVGRRPEGKKRFPNCWEFGCGQLRMVETFEECLVRSYKEDFDIDLDFLDGLTPITTYIINDVDGERKIPGIIFIARVRNPGDAKAQKHSDIDWLDPEKIDKNDSECVPDFIKTVQKAYDAWKLIEIQEVS